ncbi:MAG TPA: Mov34/MPN/PAD-1 family protein [Azospirillum sp.]|nr:Mov34/MPN/PAD-1 family protein [Azospirillum sp.]
MSILTSDIIAAAHAHALAEYPRESCGVVIDGRYVPMQNVADDPARDFRIAARAYAKVVRKAALILHSHPDGDPWPSKADMQGQLQTGKPWGLFTCNGEACGEVRLWGDGLPVPELLGRPFVPGITDCYSLVRDYYRIERGIVLPEVPRDDQWWNAGENLYLDHLDAAGFRIVPESEIQPGDSFLACIRADVPNHAGVLVGADLILHHLANRLSRREPVGPWLRKVHCWVRHHG